MGHGFAPISNDVLQRCGQQTMWKAYWITTHNLLFKDWTKQREGYSKKKARS